MTSFSHAEMSDFYVEMVSLSVFLSFLGLVSYLGIFLLLRLYIFFHVLSSSTFTVLNVYVSNLNPLRLYFDVKCKMEI